MTLKNIYQIKLQKQICFLTNFSWYQNHINYIQMIPRIMTSKHYPSFNLSSNIEASSYLRFISLASKKYVISTSVPYSDWWHLPLVNLNWPPASKSIPSNYLRPTCLSHLHPPTPLALYADNYGLANMILLFSVFLDLQMSILPSF